ncbi:MAG: DUF5050 domain-containing protein [Eubacteriales bacterium]|nr:DUF5050 domain-containing protein [Eubacteriales bacterium]
MKQILCALMALALIMTAACAAPASKDTVSAATDTAAVSQSQGTSDAEAAVEAASTTDDLKILMKQYTTDGDYEAALRCSDKMLEIDPTSQDAYYAQVAIRILLLQAGYDELNGIIAQGMEYVDDPTGYAAHIGHRLEENDLTVVMPFTPDYSSEDEINTYGITAGNQTNAAKYDGEWRGGLLTWQGDWVYLSRPDEGFAIYKMRADGSDYQRVGDVCGSSLNVIGDWLYYINVSDFKPCRMRTDGSMNEKLSDDMCSFLSVSGDYMYYDNGSDDGCLYKVSIDGSESVKLTDGTAMFTCVADGWVYYSEKSAEGGLSRVSVDGGEPQHVASGFLMNYCVAGEWLYYINQDDTYGIRRVHTDGTGDEVLFPFEFPITTFNISEDTLYIAFGIGYEEDCFHISQEIVTLDLATLTKKDHVDGADTEPLCVGPNGRLFFIKYSEGLIWYAMDEGGATTKIE